MKLLILKIQIYLVAYPVYLDVQFVQYRHFLLI